MVVIHGCIEYRVHFSLPGPFGHGEGAAVLGQRHIRMSSDELRMISDELMMSLGQLKRRSYELRMSLDELRRRSDHLR